MLCLQSLQLHALIIVKMLMTALAWAGTGHPLLYIGELHIVILLQCPCSLLGIYDTQDVISR